MEKDITINCFYVFAHARATEVRFPNPLLGREEVQTVYLAGAAPAPKPI